MLPLSSTQWLHLTSFAPTLRFTHPASDGGDEHARVRQEGEQEQEEQEQEQDEEDGEDGGDNDDDDNEEEEEEEEEDEEEDEDEDEEEDEDEAVVAGSRLAPSSTSLFRRIALIGSELWWLSDDKERVVCAGAEQRPKDSEQSDRVDKGQ